MEKCPHCDKEAKSVKYHIWRMHGAGVSHDPSLGYAAGTRNSWNKGLTKESNDIVARSAAAISRANKGKTGHPCSEKTKSIHSKNRKAYLELHPDQVPYLLNHSSTRSYPEQYFTACFAQYNNVISEHGVHRYSLDFANIVDKIYLEIDGEQHYVDARIVASDIVRTSKLSELGWTGYRIRWAHFMKLTAVEKEKKIKEIVLLMKLVS